VDFVSALIQCDSCFVYVLDGEELVLRASKKPHADSTMARLEGENASLLEKLETRELLERAKGILQRDLGIDEERAYLALQRQSRQKRKSLREIAEAVALGEELRRKSQAN